MINYTLDRHCNYSLIESLIASDSIISSSQLSNVGTSASRPFKEEQRIQKMASSAIFYVSEKPLKNCKQLSSDL